MLILLHEFIFSLWSSNFDFKKIEKKNEEKKRKLNKKYA